MIEIKIPVKNCIQPEIAFVMKFYFKRHMQVSNFVSLLKFYELNFFCKN